MCGRYLRRSDKQRIAETFRVAKGRADLVLPPWDYNVAPTTFQPVIREARDSGAGGQRELDREVTLMRWGLVPYFAKDLKEFSYSTINARAEALTSSALFRGPFERRRCLVPADGFYEWKKLPPAAPSTTGSLFGDEVPGPQRPAKKATITTRPVAFTLASGEPFAFAGLWDRWKDPAGGFLESFVIITTTPNQLTSTVHNRTPVILRPQDYDLWLAQDPAERGPDPAPQPELLRLLEPFPAELMRAQEAHPDVGNVRNNHPGLLNSI